MERVTTRWQAIGERLKKTPARLAIGWSLTPARARVMVIGLVLVSVGAACVYLPAGLIVPGVVCIFDAARPQPMQRRRAK